MPCRCSLSDIRGTHLPETWQLRFGESCQGALRPRVEGRLEQWGWVLWLGASAGQWRRSEHGERTMLCVVRQHGQAGTWQREPGCGDDKESGCGRNARALFPGALMPLIKSVSHPFAGRTLLRKGLDLLDIQTQILVTCRMAEQVVFIHADQISTGVRQ